MFYGSITALITPFRDGAVDKKAFANIIEWQIEQGTNGLVPVGTTGESPTVSHEEHRDIVSLCVEVAAGRVPVIAGAGSNATAEAVELAKFAQRSWRRRHSHRLPLLQQTKPGRPVPAF